MSSDWIKMRCNLWDDPRVSRICELTDEGEAAVVGALYWLWATADQHTESGVLMGLTLRQIDRKTGVNGFGQALCEVGWIADHPEGVRIVRFDEHNGASAKRRCSESRRKMSARDADTERTESGNCADESRKNCAPRERERVREEAKEGPSPPAVGAPPAAKAGSGSRLPDDWTLPETWAAEGKRILADLGKPEINIAREADKFRDYWRGQPGQSGRKSDWLGTWRNWMRKAAEYSRGPPAKPSAIHIGAQDYAAGWGAK